MIFFERNGIQFGVLEKSAVKQNLFLFPNEHEQLQRLQHPNRKVEFIGARQLRNNMVKNQEIAYRETGKPYLKDSKLHVSISHSASTICFGVATKPVGIDIEIPDVRSVRASSKFCSDAESKLFDRTSIDDMTFLWSMKESIYKKIDKPGLDYKKCISIVKRGLSQTICLVKNDEIDIEVVIGHEKIDDHILTFTIDH